MKNFEMAAALGITPGQCSRLVARGMPLDSVERAQRWRNRHLQGTRTVDHRPDYVAQRVARTMAAHDMPQDLAHVARLADLAAVALRTASELPAEIDAALRQALRQVPLEIRCDVSMHERVWAALCAPVVALVDEDHPTVEAREQMRQEAAQATQADKEAMHEFWFAVAAGELVVNAAPPLL